MASSNSVTEQTDPRITGQGLQCSPVTIEQMRVGDQMKQQ